MPGGSLLWQVVSGHARASLSLAYHSNSNNSGDGGGDSRSFLQTGKWASRLATFLDLFVDIFTFVSGCAVLVAGQSEPVCLSKRWKTRRRYTKNKKYDIFWQLASQVWLYQNGGVFRGTENATFTYNKEVRKGHTNDIKRMWSQQLEHDVFCHLQLCYSLSLWL